jgi:surfactin synthase thioesterase subunit
MTTHLVVSFPAAGDGGTTLEQLEALAGRRGMAYLALANPESVAALESGEWEKECVAELHRAAERVAADRVILFGHCMGGLSAIRLAGGTCLDRGQGSPVSLLVVNTPCPDPAGRIPTMSQFSDAQIAAVLAHDGFPQELLDDEDLLPEIADGLREDAVVADRLAEWISTADDLDTLHVLSTRGDTFIPPEVCAGWRHRVSRAFHLMIVDGGHALDESVVGELERAVDAVLASPFPGAASCRPLLGTESE